MKKLKLTQAFTILELITVMVVIMILAGLVVGAGSKARLKATRTKAESMIAAIEIAAGMYRIDTGLYPAQNDQNATLVSNLRDLGDSGWDGPYMEFRERDLINNEVVDPWGNAYNYVSSNPTHNVNSFDLWSIGPDERNGSDDDVTNW